jgi:hypothetical protein
MNSNFPQTSEILETSENPETVPSLQSAPSQAELLEILLHKAKTNNPSEFRYETGRLFLTIKNAENPVSTSKLLEMFYQDFQRSSEQRRKSLSASLAKLLQRARRKLNKFGLNIVYCYFTKTWQACFLERRQQPR